MIYPQTTEYIRYLSIITPILPRKTGILLIIYFVVYLLLTLVFYIASLTYNKLSNVSD